EALRKVGGEARVKLIRREPNEVIQRIVSGWPRRFDATRAAGLGFKAESSFEAIVRTYVEDEKIRV
ncbi:MAG: NAD-dependent epimerase, partial [Roseibium sp.]